MRENHDDDDKDDGDGDDDDDDDDDPLWFRWAKGRTGNRKQMAYKWFQYKSWR